MKKMILKLKRLDNSVEMPKYAHDTDAGLDLRSSVDCVLKPNEKKIIKTGLMMAIPAGYFGSIRDRSGLAAKFGIHTLAGVIDSGYRGEIGVVIVNLGTDEFKISKNDRIAQIIIQPVLRPVLEEVDDISESEDKRGSNGFGSSGMK
jgi:dUTP pyrophosphatase